MAAIRYVARLRYRFDIRMDGWITDGWIWISVRMVRYTVRGSDMTDGSVRYGYGSRNAIRYGSDGIGQHGLSDSPVDRRIVQFRQTARCAAHRHADIGWIQTDGGYRTVYAQRFRWYGFTVAYSLYAQTRSVRADETGSDSSPDSRMVRCRFARRRMDSQSGWITVRMTQFALRARIK